MNAYLRLGNLFRSQEGNPPVLTLDNYERLLDLSNGELKKGKPDLILPKTVIHTSLPMLQAFKNNSEKAPSSLIPVAFDLAGGNFAWSISLIESVTALIDVAKENKNVNKDVIEAVLSAAKQAGKRKHIDLTLIRAATDIFSKKDLEIAPSRLIALFNDAGKEARAMGEEAGYDVLPPILAHFIRNEIAFPKKTAQPMSRSWEIPGHIDTIEAAIALAGVA